MENTKLNGNGYSRIDETQRLVNSIGSLVDKYNKDTKNKEKDLKDINSQIAKKNQSIEKANKNTIDLTKKLEELESIKSSAKLKVKELEKEKTELSFSDSDVQKMEIQEFNELISSKHSKINKLSALINSTKDSINANNKDLGNLKNELSKLEKAKINAEKSLQRTNALIKLVNDSSKKFVEDIKYILSNEFLKKDDSKKEEQPPKKIEKNEAELEDMKAKTSEIINSINNFTEEEKKEIKKPKNIDVPVEDIKKEEEPKTEKDDSNVEGKDFSILDEWQNELDNKANEEEIPDINELEKEVDTKEKPILVPTKEEEPVEEENPSVEPVSNEEESPIEQLLRSEKIDTSNISKETLEEMEESIDKVKENIKILKKHLIPLDLLSNQTNVLYKIDKTDLDDLFNIITTDSDGNGMGFSTEFTYYCLNELATINVDKLIDVYNQEFMNITDKSGIISLLKKTNPELGDFKNTIDANKKLLEDLGVENTDEVEKASKKFIELDYPLFESMINIFDRTDLVNKINNDPAIVDQILEYWENN